MMNQNDAGANIRATRPYRSDDGALLNRSVLATDFAQVVAESGSAMVAVHAIDLDHFKAANDRYGHPVGDALLKQVASRLKSLAGPADLIVRMGGDEFILVQNSVPSRSDAELTAQRISRRSVRPIMWTGTRSGSAAASALRCRRSIGRTVEVLLSRSDAALYGAKERRGGYVFASEATAMEERRPRAA